MRRDDVLSRLDARCDLEAIESHQDVRWSERKVKGENLSGIGFLLELSFLLEIY